ncbi:hypothetical protein HYALB_00009339 [Hymenoscyphus albidus]|uniref:Uncharacterized protein n=1 Tax=Hymenoscyphus albidus TaxID=595503 RepID=A0A9N9Q2R4_9HELO|nr:hypothetical protein HYALB_00009339 [Hymenoscyphus albidus]
MLLPSLIGVATVLSTLVSGLPVAVPQNHGVSLHLKRNPPLMPLDEVLIASQAPFKREAAPEPQFRMKAMSALGAAKDAIKIAAKQGGNKAKSMYATGKAKTKSTYATGKAKTKSTYATGKAKVKNLPNLPEDIVRHLYKDPRTPKTTKREAGPPEKLTTPTVPKKVNEPVKKGAVDSKKVSGVVQSAKQKMWFNLVTSPGKDFTKREASPEPGTKIDALKALVRPAKASVISSKQKVTSKIKDKYKAKKASRKSKKVDKAMAKWEAQRLKDLQATL